MKNVLLLIGLIVLASCETENETYPVLADREPSEIDRPFEPSIIVEMDEAAKAYQEPEKYEELASNLYSEISHKAFRMKKPYNNQKYDIKIVLISEKTSDWAQIDHEVRNDILIIYIRSEWNNKYFLENEVFILTAFHKAFIYEDERENYLPSFGQLSEVRYDLDLNEFYEQIYFN